jgi:hypothetical protein
LSKLYSKAHSPQHTVNQDTNTGRGKEEDGDCERMREDDDLPFQKLKSLFYYWSFFLTEYLSNLKQGKLGMGA